MAEEEKMLRKVLILSLRNQKSI